MTRAVLDSSRVGKITTTIASSVGAGGYIYRILSIGSRLVFIDGSNGTFVSTDDGATWTRYKDAFSVFGNVFPFYGAVNGTYFLTVYQGYSYRSTDGITWTQHALPENPASGWTYPMSDGSQFVIAGYGTNHAYTSPDGATWTQRTLSATANWREAAWSGNVFIVCSDGTAASTSPDGITWTARTLPAAPAGNGVARLYGGGNQFFLLTNGSTCYHSSDGISWTTRNIPGTKTQYAVWDGALWLIANDNSDKVYTTSDGGANWTTRTVPSSMDTPSLYRHGGVTHVIVAGPGPIYTTSDGGANFTKKTYSGEATATAVIDMGSALIALAAAGAGEAAMLRSVNDGYTWTETARLAYPGTGLGNAGWYYLAWDGGTTLIAVPNGWSSSVARSTDNGQTWSVDAAALSGMTSQDYLNGAVWSGSSFFIGLQTTAKTFRSVTGTGWTQNTSIPDAGNITQFVGGNGKVVFGGNGGTASSADNGVTWSSVTAGSLLGFNGALFILKKPSTQHFESADGASWINETPGYNGSDIFQIAPAGNGIIARGEVWNSETESLDEFLYGSPTRVEPQFARIAIDPGLASQVALFDLNSAPAAAATDGTLYQLELLASEWTTFKTNANGGVGYVGQPFWTGQSIIAGGGTYYARLENGVWYRETIDEAFDYTTGIYGAGKAVMLTKNGAVTAAYLSTDHGKTWAFGGNVVTDNKYIESMAWDPVHAMFIAMPYGYGVAYTSPDGITWTQRAMPQANCAIVRMGLGGVAIAVPQYDTGNQYCTSSDGGITWTQRTLPVSIDFGGLATGDSCVILLSAGGTVALRSTDNLTWTQHTTPTGWWMSAAWNGRYFCSIPEDNATDVCLISVNGATWVEGPFLPQKENWYTVISDGRGFYAFPYNTNILGATSGDSIRRAFWTGFIACEEIA